MNAWFSKCLDNVDMGIGLYCVFLGKIWTLYSTQISLENWHFALEVATECMGRDHGMGLRQVRSIKPPTARKLADSSLSTIPLKVEILKKDVVSQIEN